MTEALDQSLILYHYDSCPFCMRVRWTIDELSLDIETRNIMQSVAARDELYQGGGRLTVPCLRIDRGGEDTQWMYESDDIIRFLQAL